MPYEEKKRMIRQQEKEATRRSEVPDSKRSAFSVPASRSSAISQNKTLNNRSSVHHNIITGQNNAYSQVIVPGLTDKQVCNRKLGITQLRDLAGPNKPNHNPDYRSAWGDNQNVFKRQNGIFTHLYDAAARFGEHEVFKASTM